MSFHILVVVFASLIRLLFLKNTVNSRIALGFSVDIIIVGRMHVFCSIFDLSISLKEYLSNHSSNLIAAEFLFIFFATVF